MTTKVQVKNHDFESPYTNYEVAKRFRNLVEDQIITGSFATSVYNGARQRGTYTQGQVPWLHVLVAQAEGRKTQHQMDQAGYKSIHEHLTNCREKRQKGGKGLLNPMVGLKVGDQEVVLKLAGKNSRNFGKVSVASSHRFGEGDFYGWIDGDGVFKPYGSVPKEVIGILDRVAVDPVRVISEIGKESGRCCYCFAELSTVQSKIAGCGPVCGDKWGAWYPNASEVRGFILDHPEILDGASDRDRWV
jgi:hypothetical protein